MYVYNMYMYCSYLVCGPKFLVIRNQSLDQIYYVIWDLILENEAGPSELWVSESEAQYPGSLEDQAVPQPKAPERQYRNSLVP